MTKNNKNNYYPETININNKLDQLKFHFIDKKKIFSDLIDQIDIPDYIISYLLYLITLLQNLTISSHNNSSNMSFNKFNTRTFPFVTKNGNIINVSFLIIKTETNKTKIFALINYNNSITEYPMLFNGGIKFKKHQNNPFINLIKTIYYKPIVSSYGLHPVNVVDETSTVGGVLYTEENTTKPIVIINKINRINNIIDVKKVIQKDKMIVLKDKHNLEDTNTNTNNNVDISKLIIHN